jgi:hypothetical protein
VQKAFGIVVVLLAAMWLIAPAQTETLVKNAVDLISHRISQSDTSSPAARKGHATAELVRTPQGGVVVVQLRSPV